MRKSTKKSVIDIKLEKHNQRYTVKNHEPEFLRVMVRAFVPFVLRWYQAGVDSSFGITEAGWVLSPNWLRWRKRFRAVYRSKRNHREENALRNAFEFMNREWKRSKEARDFGR